MLMSCYRTEKLVSSEPIRYMRTASDLLHSIVTRKISISTVIADRGFTSEEAQDTVQVLSREAADKGLLSIIKELGEVESLAVDPLKDVPEVLPARRNKVFIWYANVFVTMSLIWCLSHLLMRAKKIRLSILPIYGNVLLK